jgi:outer membrane protein TolC
MTLGMAGCASSSTRGDLRTVNALVEQRTQLRWVERDPERFEAPEPDVRRLLARPLTVDSALKIALLNNRDLRAELRDLGIARGDLVQASLLPNPEVEAQVGFPQGGSGEGPKYELGVAFDLTHALLIPKRTGVAEADLDATRYRVAGAVLDFTYRVRLAFYEVQARQQTLELQQTALAALTASYEATRALHAAGNITALDLSTEQAAYEQARISVAEAEADHQDSRERLTMLLGLFGESTQWRVEARLADPPQADSDTEGLEARAIGTSLELAEARARLLAQARRAGLTEAEGWLPDLSVGVHAERDDESWEIGPMVSGTLPLFDRQQGRVLSEESEFDALRERYVATAVAIRSAVRAGRNRLKSAEERARHYRTIILPLRERVVAETLLQYNAMQVGVFQLLQARRDQLAAASAYIETLAEYWQARAAMHQLVSGRLSGTMEQVVSGRARATATTGARSERH